MQRVLVTGATGFIGGRLARHLIECGYAVRALVRNPGGGPARELARAGVELTPGDVNDEASLDLAMAGVEGVFHLAAIYDFGIDPDRMRAVNVDGARCVLDAAARHGVRRILYTGSDTSLGDTGGQLRDETHRSNSPPRSAYELTKREAHDMVAARAAAGEPIIHAIVSTVYGPGDVSPIGELLGNIAANKVPFVIDPGAGYTLAHVDDVAEGIRLAYERGKPGESYLISGTPVSFGDLHTMVARMVGVRPPWHVPRLLRPILAPLAMVLGALLFRKPLRTMRELVAMARGVTRYFSNARARDELGWRSRPLEQGLAETMGAIARGPLTRPATADGGPRTLARSSSVTDARLLRSARIFVGGLAAFDLILGGLALFAPETYLSQLHGDASLAMPTGLLARTGTLWLFFAAVELAAFWRPTAATIAWVGVLRLMDVPADLVYRFTASSLSDSGGWALLFAPAFNLAAGLWLLSRARAARTL